MSQVTADQLKELIENDFWAYCRYMLPHYAFGDVHKEVAREMGSEDRRTEAPNWLGLIPRDHLKSVMAACYSTWRVAKRPSYTILYITADEDLGRLQMAFMQQIFESDRFTALYPDHFLPEAGRRDKWTSLAINTDHPDRKLLNVRDETIACKTIKSGKTGRHPDEIVYDDLVVPENAYTEVGRREVRAGAAAAVSLAKSNALMTAVGTTYHPKDQYAIWEEAMYDKYDDEGVAVDSIPLWKVFKRKVETVGDLSGEFLWPRTYSTVTKEWYGWNKQSLAKKRAEYLNNGEQAQFYAQYYMEPNDPTSHRLKYDDFQYWDPRHLEEDRSTGVWYYQKRKLNIIATMDTAQTDASSRNARKADYTAIAVVAQCTDGFYYILDLDEFQTDKRTVYWEHIIKLWTKWKFKRVHVELEGAGKLVAEGLKDLNRQHGYSLVVDGAPAPRGISKHERHASIALPKYEQGIVFHQRAGLHQKLEEQLMLERPPNDDLLDAVTEAMRLLRKPMGRTTSFGPETGTVISAHNKFGGRRG